MDTNTSSSCDEYEKFTIFEKIKISHLIYSNLLETGLKFSELLMNNNADLNILTKIGEKPETLAELYGNW